MRTRIDIKNMRGIATGRVDELAPLSILTGPNNSGKSTVLEALCLCSPRAQARLASTIIKRRGWIGLVGAKRFAREQEEPIEIEVAGPDLAIRCKLTVITGVDSDLADSIGDSPSFTERVQVSIHVTDQGNGRDEHSAIVLGGDGSLSTLTYYSRLKDLSPVPTFIGAGTVSAQPEPELEDAYSSLIDRGEGGEAELDQLARELDPTHPKLRIMKTGSKFVLHAVRSDGAVPVYFEGDGFKRLVLIACSLAGSAGGLALLEDPECYLHPAYLGRLSGLIRVAIEQGTQVVMTTHSVELLQKLLIPESGLVEKAALFMVRLRDGVLTSNRIAGPRAAERLHELGEDLRM